jgi:hypothetical protein
MKLIITGYRWVRHVALLSCSCDAFPSPGLPIKKTQPTRAYSTHATDTDVCLADGPFHLRELGLRIVVIVGDCIYTRGREVGFV